MKKKKLNEKGYGNTSWNGIGVYWFGGSALASVSKGLSSATKIAVNTTKAALSVAPGVVKAETNIALGSTETAVAAATGNKEEEIDGRVTVYNNSREVEDIANTLANTRVD